MGSASSYGHVKLSDSYTASGGAAANGVCASSKAVNEVYKKFNEENTTNSGQNIQSITSSVDNYTDIKSIDISPGVYVAVLNFNPHQQQETGKVDLLFQHRLVPLSLLLNVFVRPRITGHV